MVLINISLLIISIIFILYLNTKIDSINSDDINTNPNKIIVILLKYLIFSIIIIITFLIILFNYTIPLFRNIFINKV
jgi:hypothetical protein